MKIKVSVGIGLLGCRREKTVEVDDDELSEMTEDERSAYLEDIARDWMLSLVEWDWQVV